MEKSRPCTVRVAVALPLTNTFTYLVPAHLDERTAVGHRVLVPFRSRNVTGYVLEKDTEEEGGGLREITDVLDDEPLFHRGIVPFFQWMSDYYLCPIGRLIQAALPGGLNSDPYKTGRITDKGLRALDLLPQASEERRYLLRVKENPGRRLPPPLGFAEDFRKKGWLLIEERRSPRRARPLIRTFVRVRKGVDPETFLSRIRDPLKARNEAEFLDRVLSREEAPVATLCSGFGNAAYLIGKWVKKGLLERYRAPVARSPQGGILFPASAPELHPQQIDVIEGIRPGLDTKGFAAYLLHGVTGSGKTEIYCRAAERAIRAGRQVIMLVPEIALAVYLEGVFRSRIGERIAVYHSGLSQGERYDQWMRMARGEVDLVLGARSAIFAPLPRPGLIVVDEEHDFSYKQEENPRYQARDAAVVRARFHKAVVLLGSGTPSVQSYHNTITGRYRLLTMPERVEKRPLPEIRVVDMKDAAWADSGEGIVSVVLKDALARTLEQGKQAILFLNRRGFHKVLLCRRCGEPLRCRNCDVTLTYHLKENYLNCHYCGYRVDTQARCNKCGHREMRAYGFGTERLEQVLRDLFPRSSIERIDRDSTSRKGTAFKILKRFNEQRIDILVGTQMITKGYDFPEVTLVGVVAADLSLGFPDFRAGERTFQILSQVAGRSGRGENRGEVIIQTFNPEHYAVGCAREHDYPTFYQKERELREQLGYPPFSYLACIRVQGNNQSKAQNAARHLGREMEEILRQWPKRGKEIRVLGPVEAPISRLKGKYRWQILVKSRTVGLRGVFLKQVDALSRRILKGSGVGMTIDVDPYSML